MLFIYHLNIFNVNYQRFPKSLIFCDIKIFSLGIVGILRTTDRRLGTPVTNQLCTLGQIFSFPSHLLFIKLLWFIPVIYILLLLIEYYFPRTLL